MRNLLLKLILVSIIIIFSDYISYSQTYLEFVENRNQWAEQVEYRADIPSGVIFLEKGCFTFLFYDQEDVHKCLSEECHADHDHKEQNTGKSVHFHAFKYHFVNSNPNLKISGNNEYDHYYNYFLGNDKAKWASNVQSYRKVNYKNIYNNIDLDLYQDGLNLKYDFIIYPGGDIKDIVVEYEGVDDLEMIDNSISVNTSVIDLIEEEPYAYQVINGEKKEIECKYILNKNSVKFKVGKYDKTRELIIDPVLMFSTYSGSFSNNFGYTASYDSEGHLYSGSTAFGPNYPTTVGAFQTNYNGDSNNGNVNDGTDIAITKWTLDGSGMIYSTFLGGAADELPHSIFVNSESEVYLYGTTGSPNFPVTANAVDQTFNGGTSFVPNGLGMDYDTVFYNNDTVVGSDIIVSKLSSDGQSLLGSTYIGGSDNDGINTGILRYNYADEVRGEILIDENHNVYIVTSTFSDDFPVTAGAFQTTPGDSLEGCIIKLNSDLSSIIWSSYIGGSGTDAAYSVVLDSNNDIYISGGTNSIDFPTTSGVINASYIGGMSDAFVAHISQDGQNIIKSSYFGSDQYDQAYFVELNGSDDVYLFGQTLATGSTLIVNALYNTPESGQFISVLTPDLSTIIRSTMFGTAGSTVNISPTAFLVDVCDKIYICGWGGNINAYGHGGNTYGMDVNGTSGAAFQSTTDGSDFYLAVFEDDLSALHYGTFMGSPTSAEHVDGGTSRFSKKGKIYEAVCAGCWGDSGFPTTTGAWSNVNNNSCNLAVFKFDFMLPITVADFPLPLNVCAPYTHSFDNLSQYANSYLWDFGDGDTSMQFEPVHVFDSVGTFFVTLTAFGDSSCNYDDSTYHIINVHSIDLNVPNDTTICQGENIIINVNSTETNAQFIISSNPNFTDTLNPNPGVGSLVAWPNSPTTYYIFVDGQYCDAMDSVNVNVVPVGIDITPDMVICQSDTGVIDVTNLIPGDVLNYVWSPTGSIISGIGTSTIEVNPSTSTTYYVTATNQFGCADVDTVTVSVDNVNVNENYIINVTCFGDCNGQIGTTMSSGMGPYTYEWSNNQTTPAINNLCPGSFSLTVTDINGCKDYYSGTIVEPPLLEAYISDTVHATCDSVQSNIGSATVAVTGGTPGYNYFWSNFQTDSIADNLYAGFYTCTITDLHGCDTIVSVEINDGSNLEADATGTDATCFGYCDGTGTALIITAGIPPYTYTWDNNQTGSNANGLCVGYHYVTVIDKDWCIRIEDVFIGQPDSIEAEADVDPIVCFGDSTMATAMVINGGTAPYQYEWNTGVIGPVISDIPVGTYYFIVTDSNDCKDTTWVNIMQPPPLAMDSVIRALACAEACNGRIIVQMQGGVSPYTFNWSNGMAGANISALCSGDYEVTITDNLGCSLTAAFFVDISDYIPPLEATADDYNIYMGQSTILHATNDPNYIYVWTPTETINIPNIADPRAHPEITTTYQVLIIDRWGCSNTDTVTIHVSDVICDEPYIYVPNAFTPNNDGQNDVLYVQSNIVSELYFAIYDRWGEIVFETDDINIGWDGTYKGEPVDPAVFVYYMSAVCLDEKTFIKKGNITVIR